jgi:hypothetical protein
MECYGVGEVDHSIVQLCYLFHFSNHCCMLIYCYGGVGIFTLINFGVWGTSIGKVRLYAAFQSVLCR